MPYVNIKVTRDGVTAEQKARLIKGVTDLLVEVLGKDPATTMVVIDEWTRTTGVSAESRSAPGGSQGADRTRGTRRGL